MEKERDIAKDVAIELCAIIYDLVKSAGEGGLPSGHLYAMLIGEISLETYQALICTLKKHGFITEKFNILTAKVPFPKPPK